MNNKDLAKLLLKHPIIKKINESQMWDKSVVSRVIAEELMAEQDSKDAIKKMGEAISSLEIQIDGYELDLEDKQKELRKASRLNDGYGETVIEEDIEMLLGLMEEKRQELAKMKEDYKKLSSKAKVTPEITDDEAVETSALEDAESLETTRKELPKQIATIKNAKGTPKAAKQAVQQVSRTLKKPSTDNVEKVAQAMANTQPEREPKQNQNPPQAKGGWKNAKASVNNFLTNKFADSTKSSEEAMKELKDALQNVESFRQYFNINESRVSKDRTFAQAKELMDRYIAKRIGKILANNNSKGIVDDTSNLVATVSSVENTDVNADVVTKAAKALLDSEEIPDSVEALRDILDASSEEGTLGDSDSGEASPTMIDKWLLDNSLQDLTLFKNEKFKAEFEKLLVQAFASKGENFAPDNTGGGDSNSENTPVNQDSVEFAKNADDNRDSDGTLQEEVDAEAPPQTKTVSKEESAKVRAEVDAIIKALKKSKLLTTDLDTLLKKQLSDLKPEEVQQEVEKDLSTENQTPARVYSEQQYEILATFFADKGGKGLGFMQQLLLRRQSEQLQNLIKTLEDIIDPDKNQMKSLTRTPVNEQQEETQEPTIELEPREQRKLKTELIGLLSALKNLKTLSKAYEENMTRTSVDPRYDGSSLKARLDEMLPEIQNAIARILKMIQDFFGDLQRVEPDVVSEQQEGGLDREAKIDLVEDVYSEMRVIWTTLGPALKDTFKQEEPEQTSEPPSEPQPEATQAESLLREKDASRATEAVVKNATDMKELATREDFISLFPTIVFAGGGKVVSIEQANEVLSGVISEFIYVMRNVVALVKGEQITEGTAIEVKGKLTDIAKAIQNSFGIPAARIVEEIEKEMSTDEGNQALTDTSQEGSGGIMDTLKGLWNKLKEKFNWLSEELLKKISESIPKAELEPFLLKIEEMDTTPDEKRRIIEDIADATMWFNTLEDREQRAVRNFIWELKNIRDQKGINENKDILKKFYVQAQRKGGIKRVPSTFHFAYGTLDEEDKGILLKIMKNEEDNFIQFIVNLLKNPEMIEDILKILDQISDPSGIILPKPPGLDMSDEDDSKSPFDAGEENGGVEPEEDEEDGDMEADEDDYRERYKIDDTSGYYKGVVKEMYELLGEEQDSDNKIEISNLKDFKNFIEENDILNKNMRDNIKWDSFPDKDDEIKTGVGTNEKELAEVFYLLHLIAGNFKAKGQVSEGLMDSIKEKSSKFFRKRNLKKRLEKKLDYKHSNSKKNFSSELDKLDLNFLKSSDDKQEIRDFFNFSLSALEEKINPKAENGGGNSFEESLQEALKPIIAKMLKEHHG